MRIVAWYHQLTASEQAGWISALGSAGQFVVVLIATVVAICQLRGWKKQVLSQRRAQIAEEILVSVQRLKDELLFCRRAPDPSADHSSPVHVTPEFYDARLSELREVEGLVSQLATAGIRQRIVIGNQDVNRLLLDMIQCEEELRHAYVTLRDALRRDRKISSSNELGTLRRLAIERSPDKDTFRIRLRENVRQLETELAAIVAYK